MCQLVGSLSVYAKAPFFETILKGPHLLVCELLLWSWEIKIGRVEPNLVSYLVLNCWAFLLVILGFHLIGGFFE